MKKRDEGREAKKFGLILGVAALLLGAWKYKNGRTDAGTILAGVGVLLCAAPFVLSGLWLAFFRKWMKLAEAISFVMTRVILGIFFFLFMTPIAVIMRAAGRKPLDVDWKDGRASYWIEKPAGEYTIERYRNRF